jgi:Holliday junction resolvase RusA-like endonuclease
VKPDVLKLARAVEDALTGILYRDDAQIVTEVLRKRYGDPPRVEIRLSPVATLDQILNEGGNPA